MDVSFSPLPLHLRHPFTITRESSRDRQNVLVKIADADGRVGLGEAAPSRYYHQTAESVTEQLGALHWPAQTDPFLLEDLLGDLAQQLPGHSSAVAALDMALHDLVGQRLDAPLYRLLGLDPQKAPVTSYTIGIDSPDQMRRKAEEAAGYPLLKVKLGTDDDRRIIASLRQVVSVPIRVDANAAWTLQQALENLPWLAGEGVELLEQPLAKDDLDGLARLTEAGLLPIIADESAVTPLDVVKLRGAVDGINIKLGKCGGIRNALKMIHIARAQGMKVMLGCFIESSLGITAAAHLSPLVDFADLDGHLLIDNDPFGGVTVEAGRLILPDRPGLGMQRRESEDPDRQPA